MPDGPATIGIGMDAFSVAAKRVEDWLGQLGGAPQPLGGHDLARYPGRGFIAGWRLSVRFSDGDRRLDVLLTPSFPWTAPRIALVDRPSFLSWPHVEKDGVLCLSSNNLSVDPDQPVNIATYHLSLASELVEKLIHDECDNDFADEFLSYWSFASNFSGKSIVSLIDPASPSRKVRLWRGKTFYVIGDNDETISAWLSNLYGTKLAGFKTDAAAFLWIGAPPMPRDYPETAQALLSMAGRAEQTARAVLDELAIARPEKLIAVLGFNTANGPALAATIVSQPAASSRGVREPLTKGFRPGTVPDEILASRYYGGGKLSRAPVERADSAWIHGRGQDERAFRLNHATVAIIGCGSIGAPVAIALAQAGVGHLVLIDFDHLKWANVSRHPLGASYVGQEKSKSLANRLRSDFPHARVDHHVVDVDTIIRTCPDVLRACDVIVSATGNWAADSRLDDWHAAFDRSLPVVYGWTEAHACAGHAVLIKGQGCLRCGFDGTGLPNLQVTTWPNGPTERQEPACGATYQPYGPVELGFINSLLAELALDALLGTQHQSVHRIWAGPHKRLAPFGGEWTAEWQRIARDRLEGGFILDLPWAATTCTRCQNLVAA